MSDHHSLPSLRLRGLGLLLSSVACATAAHAAGPMVQRWRCTMLDGDVRVVVEDLSRTFPAAVTACEVFNAPAAAQSDMPPVAGGTLDRRGVGSIEPWGPQSGPGPAPRLMPADLEALVRNACERHGLNLAVVSALIYVESRYRPDAQSPKGALGLMQVMPATGARYGVESPQALRDPRTNVEVGVRYLRDLQTMFGGRTELVLAAYNAGEGAVMKYGRQIPPYRETQSYVRQIMALANQPLAATP